LPSSSTVTGLPPVTTDTAADFKVAASNDVVVNPTILTAPEPGSAITSLAWHAAAPPSPAGLLDGLLARLDRWLERSPDDVLVAYRERCATLGSDVRVVGPRRAFEGTATGITPTGELEVLVEDAREVVRAGDVVHVRAR